MQAVYLNSSMELRGRGRAFPESVGVCHSGTFQGGVLYSPVMKFLSSHLFGFFFEVIRASQVAQW